MIIQRALFNCQTRFCSKMVAKEIRKQVSFFFFKHYLPDIVGVRYLRRIPYATEHETGIKGGLEAREWGPEGCSSRPR